ncbi:MAG: DUF6878 family protein [Verrucomicrobiota bacterium]
MDQQIEKRSNGRADHHQMDTLRRLLPILRKHEINMINVSFDGCGDSGSIDRISFDPAEADDIQNAKISYLKSQSQFEDGTWLHTTSEVEGRVEEAIEELTYDYLEETGVDWYNDDGGFGELVIDVRKGIVEYYVNTRYTVHEVAFSHELTIE